MLWMNLPEWRDLRGGGEYCIRRSLQDGGHLTSMQRSTRRFSLCGHSWSGYKVLQRVGGLGTFGGEVRILTTVLQPDSRGPVRVQAARGLCVGKSSPGKARRYFTRLSRRREQPVEGGQAKLRQNPCRALWRWLL
jgi:hypothetical protein